MRSRLALAGFFLAVLLGCCSCASFGPLGEWSEVLDGEGPAGPGDAPTVRDIAISIDDLERHIERFGSIVPQHASVWGQSRLMMHRNEFERVMRADAYTFAPSIQATISASDQAFLANAMSLQAGVGQVAAADPMSLLASPNDAITRNQLVKTAAISNYVTPTGKLALEPTLLEDQKKRYLDHLFELRRINEGDDNTDAPGYGLNLVRLPISVLSGSHTQTGFGAECTFTAMLHLPDDLLPQTFRNLVVNDIVKMLTLPLTRLIELKSEQELGAILATYEELRALGSYDEAARAVYGQLATTFASTTPFSPRHLNTAPVPASQIIPTFGAHNLGYLAQQLRKTVQDHLTCKGGPYHLDVQASLVDELGAAYEFLATPRAAPLWQHCTPILAEAIRTQDLRTIVTIQGAFFDQATELMNTAGLFVPVPPKRLLTPILAWTVLVDSALLTEKFLQDMKATHAAKGCPCVPGDWPPLFLPQPPPEVCQAFNAYVQCRWPLHIFALDPETEDQNVGDSFSLRREMQLALSVAFTSGKISARNFTQYVRRIEKDIDTIALNRTIVGFSHGDNTFGWRFYPRVQTPPIAGNLQTIFRDLLIGGYGPGYDLRRRRLENGIRECVALVIMPSFVPYIDLEVTANWFRLANPKCKSLTLRQAMRLSRAVKALQDRSTVIPDDAHYRPGDVGLMFSKLEQLSQRLPLQHQLVNVPYENTHGGFELLSTGVTDLAPELDGWYGAPGINPNGETSLFLVGDNFSVHQTRVVIGGHWLDPSCTIDCNTTGYAPADCTCSIPAAAMPAAAAPAPAPAATSGRAAPASLGAPLAGEVGRDGGVQTASFNPDRRGASNTRPPTPTTILNVVPAAQAVVPPGVIRPPLGTATTTKSTSTTTKQSSGSGDGGTTSGGDTSKGGGGSGGGGAATGGGGSGGGGSGKGGGAAAPASDGQAKAAVAQQQTSDVTTSATTTNPNAQVQIPHFQVELLSRQVMRVVIPRGVYSNNGYVDVHIATPYGVSPRLAIPVLCWEAKKAAADLLQLSDGAATIRCCWSADRCGPCGGKLEPVNWAPGNVVLKWAAAKELTPNSVLVRLAFETPNGKLPATTMTLAGKKGSFNLPVSELTAYLLDALTGVGQYKPGDALPAAIQGTITVLKTDDTPVYGSIGAVSQKLQVRFELVLAGLGPCLPHP